MIITIPGEPVAKGRPRFTTRGNHARAITPKKTVNFESLVALFAADQFVGEPYGRDVALTITIDAYHKRPKRLCRRKDPTGRIKKTSRPDVDNLGKSILDGLQNAGIFVDDAQIQTLIIRKWYCSFVALLPAVPRTVVKIEANVE